MRKVLEVTMAIMLSLVLSTNQANAITYPDSGFVTPAQAPFVVSMWEVNETNDRAEDGFLCTGELLDKFTIMIAAHCIEAAGNSSYVFVRGQESKTSRGEVLFARSVTVHPKYNPVTISNDIALVNLYYPASSSTYLHIPDAKIEKTILKNRPTLYGWGLLHRGLPTKKLVKARLRDMRAEGIASFPDTFNPKVELAAGRANANGTFTAACSGDSGAPLVGTVSKKTYVIGVVSYGLDSSCETATPTIFTRVAAYAKWIAATRSELAASRTTQQVDISQAHFINSVKKPLLISSGTSNGIKYRYFEASFVTENMGEPQSDIKQIKVSNYQSTVGQWDIALQVISKQPWSNAKCGLGTAAHNVDEYVGANIPGQISLVLRSGTKWQSALIFTYSAQRESCIPLEGQLLQPQAVNGAQVPSGCDAAIYGNGDGTLSFALSRTCLPAASNTYVRLIQSTYGVTDIEPGLDHWAGPMNLANPA